MPERRLYTVTAQRPATIVTATNQVLQGIELHVETDAGVAFILTVPSDSNPSYIDSAIKQELSKRHEIARLGTE